MDYATSLNQSWVSNRLADDLRNQVAMNHRRNAVLTLFLLLPMIGCRTLTPYSEIATALPEANLIEIDGQRIHVETSGNDRSAPPMVLLHGFAASTYSFRDLIPLLAEERRVIALDLNGFGYTERPTAPAAYSLPAQMETILKLLAEMEVTEFDLVGHSYGTVIAAALAVEHPDRVQHLALISPMAGFEPPPWYLRNPAGQWVALGLVRGLVSNPSRFRGFLKNAYYQQDILTTEVSEEYRRRLAIEGLPDAFWGFARSMAAAPDKALPYFQITTPTLVIAGRHDQVVDPSDSAEVRASIQRSALVILENSGHSSPEEEPGALSAILLEFTE